MERLNIIKIGGNVIDDEKHLNSFLNDFSKIPGLKILVHGGGKSVNNFSNEIGVIPQMIDGRRITNADTLKYTIMFYAGLINKKIVAVLQTNACNAIGLSGADAGIILSKKRKVEEIDFGFVGDININDINSTTLSSFLEMGLTPIICPITYSKVDGLLNTNADTIASRLAISMSSNYQVKLTYCFEKPGVLIDTDKNESVVEMLSERKFMELQSKGDIHSGMIPKLESIFAALHHGVDQIKLCHFSEVLQHKHTGSGTKFVINE